MHLDSKLAGYSGIVLYLGVYALLPLVALSWIYSIYRVIAVVFIVELYFPKIGLSQYLKKTPVSTIQDVTHQSVTLMGSFLGYIQRVCNIAKESKVLSIILALSVLILPNRLIYLTQYLSIYILSLCSYKLGYLVCKRGFKKLLEKPEQAFSPEKDKLDPLYQSQMKLVTMILFNLWSFLPFTHSGVVALFTILPMSVPFITTFFSMIVRKGYQQWMSGYQFSKRDFKASIFFLSILSLLINYKYEHYVVNFLMAMYSSVVIGQIAENFYNISPEDQDVCSEDDLVNVLYNSSLILAFWGACLLYEITIFVPIPRIIFVGVAIGEGVSLNLANQVVGKLFSMLSIHVDKPVRALSQWVLNPLKSATSHRRGCDQTQVSALQFGPSGPVA